MSHDSLLLRTSGACDIDPGHLIDVFGEQRQRFAGLLSGFGPDDWAAPTRCAQWSAHTVVRHLCDVTTAGIAAGPGDSTFDFPRGFFDPRITPGRWLATAEAEPPGVTLDRYVATTGDLLALARDRLSQGHAFDVWLTTGPMDWTVMILHLFWDSWIHERDVLLARGLSHPTSDDAIAYAVSYGVFIAAVGAVMSGGRVSGTLTLSGAGGGLYRLDDQDGLVTLTVARATAEGPPAAQTADALAGRSPVDASLSRLSGMARFMNAPA